MRAALGLALAGVGCVGLAACNSCKTSASTPAPSSSAAVMGGDSSVSDLAPGCWRENGSRTLPGSDIVAGDAAIGRSGLLLGLLRTSEGGKRVASVMHASLDLSASFVVDVGVPLGDEPPPSPRWNGPNGYVAFVASHSADGGARLRELRIASIDLTTSSLGKVQTTVFQQADESTAFDVAWDESGAGLAAWDEDAPGKAGTGTATPFGRGFVKVQSIAEGARARVVSPESTDAEFPRLHARPGGGFWLAWLARRSEEEAYQVEGPGEPRTFRWVEVVPLDRGGEPTGPVRRVSSEKGRAVSFELAASGADLVVLVQDEVALAEGAGARVVRHVVGGANDALDLASGIGSDVADLVPAITDPTPRWLAWTDTAERAHMTLLGPGLTPLERSTAEPSLDGARVLAALSSHVIYALGSVSLSRDASRDDVRSRPELRRLVCPSSGTSRTE